MHNYPTSFFYIFALVIMVVATISHTLFPTSLFISRAGSLLVVLGIVVAARGAFRLIGPANGGFDFRGDQILFKQGTVHSSQEASARPHNEAIDEEYHQREMDRRGLSIHGPILAGFGTLIWGWADLLFIIFVN